MNVVSPPFSGHDIHPSVWEKMQAKSTAVSGTFWRQRAEPGRPKCFKSGNGLLF